jgi:endoribonuclease Dicer
VFVVPLVHLVFQQGNVIEANTVAHVKRMCSEVYGHPKSWEQWQRLFDTEDVLIMTAQIFLSALSHSLISISQVYAFSAVLRVGQSSYL